MMSAKILDNKVKLVKLPERASIIKRLSLDNYI